MNYLTYIDSKGCLERCWKGPLRAGCLFHFVTFFGISRKLMLAKLHLVPEWRPWEEDKDQTHRLKPKQSSILATFPFFHKITEWTKRFIKDVDKPLKVILLTLVQVLLLQFIQTFKKMLFLIEQRIWKQICDHLLNVPKSLANYHHDQPQSNHFFIVLEIASDSK